MLWTVLWRSKAVFFCVSVNANRLLSLCRSGWRPAQAVSSCVDMGCEHGIQIQILHVEAAVSFVLFHQISQGLGHHIRTHSCTYSGCYFALWVVWTLSHALAPHFLPSCANLPFSLLYSRPPQQHMEEGR